ncbi:MAG: hypothetical protein ACI9KE_004925 [Polyangiales bacterium]|jgi:hypothetical protein
MPKLRPIEPDAITSLPVQVVEDASFRCTPVQLVASFKSDEDWKDWFNLKVTRTTTGAYREGFTRTVKAGPMVLHEVFTEWTEPNEMSFYVDRTNNPLLKAFAEHYLVTETATGCTFRWQIGMEFTRAGQLVAPLFKAAMARSARRGFPKLEALALKR